MARSEAKSEKKQQEANGAWRMAHGACSWISDHAVPKPTGYGCYVPIIKLLAISRTHYQAVVAIPRGNQAGWAWAVAAIAR